jgi:DNA-binding MarR family transcriptional regulator
MPIKLQTTEASETWRAVMTAFTRVNTMLAEEMEAQSSVSLDWYSILLMLSQVEGGSMRPSDLADHLGLSRSGTTRLIDRLEKDGIVERRSCGTDRRGTFVGLTREGEQQFREAGRIHLRGINEHVGSHLDSDEMADLRRILTKLAEGVDRDELGMIANTNTGT